MDGTIQGIDRTMQLPKELIHHMLPCLLTMEAARTSVLSKTWLRAWSTYPNLDFTERNFTKEPSFKSVDPGFKEKDDPQIEEARERFLKYVDKTMIRYHNEGIPIDKCRLDLISIDPKWAYFVDNWIGILVQNHVKELEVSVSDYSFLGSTLKKHLCHGTIKLYSLKMLSLRRVCITEEEIQNIISSCPLIQELRLQSCRGLKRLQVANLHNLNLVSVSDLEEVEISAPTLQSFMYAVAKDMPGTFKIDSSPHLKNLKVTNLGITDDFVHELLHKFPVLEKLNLSFCHWLESINISSRSLKNIIIRRCMRLLEAKIDAPNLLSFKYDRMPRLSITITVPVIEHLELRAFDDLRCYDSLLDCLFWTCHPTKLSLKSCNKLNETLIEKLCEMPMEREEDPFCCSSANSKCWRHHLKDVEVGCFELKNEVERPLHWKTLLPSLGEHQGICFNIKLFPISQSISICLCISQAALGFVREEVDTVRTDLGAVSETFLEALKHRMEEGPWTIFCGNSVGSHEFVNNYKSGLSPIINPYSCINHALVISIDILVILVCLFTFIYKPSASKTLALPDSQRYFTLRISSATLNVGLGLVYFGLGIWILVEKLISEDSVLPLHGWLTVLFQGFTWLFLGITVSLRRQQYPHIMTIRLCSVLAFLFSGFLCIPSIWVSIVDKVVSVKCVLDMFSFPGAILLLLCAFGEQKYEESNIGALYEPLQGESADSGNENITPFATAGFLSRMSFWWLNPLLAKGKEKVLEDKDIPKLRHKDRAETCYVTFMEMLSKQKEKGTPNTSVLKTIFLWQWKAILVSGFFALIKVLTLATDPLFLKAFILVAEGKETFTYEGWALAAGLFLGKCFESVSERQWNFRTRLIGLQIRSLLTAAIYQKQLKLSNAAKTNHSPGQITNYVTVDAYRIGEFPYWFHQIWTIGLQTCLAFLIIYYAMGTAAFAAVLVIILTMIGNYPVAKLQHKYLTKLMVAQDRRLKAIAEALTNMKVLKLYAWETHFKNVVEKVRREESNYLLVVLSQRGYYLVLFWASPIIVSVATFWACYLLGIPLNASNVFTFLATLRILQEPIKSIPDVGAVFIEAKVSFSRVMKFLDEPELQNRNITKRCDTNGLDLSILIRTTRISWDSSALKPTLNDVNLEVQCGEKIAICGEVGSGKSTLIATVLGEVPDINGIVQVHGNIAYVSQTAWIQTGTIQENILFGSTMDLNRYQEVLDKCSLRKDLEMLPFGDCTIIGERGVNLSGGQKQRIQLARALYQDADIYLLDDPFSAVDAYTATSLFNEYVMGALERKTVLLVTHQVDFLPAFDSILLLSEGKIVEAATYDQMLAFSQQFQNLVNAHKVTSASELQSEYGFQKPKSPKEEIQKIYTGQHQRESLGDQLIKEEERETGYTGLKPYIQYLNQSKGFLYLSLSVIFHCVYIIGQFVQSLWLAANLQDSSVSRLELIIVYSVIGCGISIFFVLRSYFVVMLGTKTSESIFSKLMTSLFRAPISFHDSTPLGRILSRVSSDMSIVDLELAFIFTLTIGTTMNTYFSFGVLAFLTWPILFVILPTVYITIILQRFYFASAKELTRIDGTTKSSVASHLAETVAGAVTIRAFGEEERFFAKNFQLIDENASSFFHKFSANEWLIQRLEILCSIVLSCSALGMTLLSNDASKPGFIGMALTYGLSLNVFLVWSVQSECTMSNSIVAVERLEQYMNIPSEAPEIIEGNRSALHWPVVGKVEICDLKVRYRPNSPLVLRGISCIFEGGDKIGIVGRTGSGKTTLISALFRLVEPTEGSIIIDDVNISTLGLHDLRSHFGVIPQDPTLFSGSVRYNLDPLMEHDDQEIWEVLEKCQLREAVQEKEEGLSSLVVQDGSNWSMGQRQLFCLGRTLLRRRKILVLDEATASIDNATDSVIQKTIRTEFADCTVITVAHRIPTVMDCTMVLSISDGQVVEYDEPMKLMSKDDSLFGKLVKEYWSHSGNVSQVVESDKPMKLMSKEYSLFGQLVKEYWSHFGNVSGHLEDQ
ncbi:hypothetical protein RHMOL_Rhmol02G0299200 [Rhododendron molle]|uniref:Uncharacterized protein n=1 Tax=Rhododendron molle TaxID=49168 RepID=A0ACC0PX29_RHOML|nr:hypothetical protein RHMOL_Rhmol02G0299200 [Rhododendron molle]